MNYKKISISGNGIQQEILIALLSDIGFEGFEEADDALLAYIPEEQFSQSDLDELLSFQNVTGEVSSVEKKNWNEEWERNFQPVIVAGFCTVRADFHQIEATTPYDIIITPKMSFGTGHHATTQLVMDTMQSLPFRGKAVLDFGTGTGILGILASMLGAKAVTGIDNEDWSCENAMENATRNHIGNFEVLHGSLERVADKSFDIILANINRHILLQYMSDMYDRTKAGGTILMSGILTEDTAIVTNAAVEVGFSLKRQQSMNNWMVLVFTK
ncbi:MAG TPA: 50S ribosomal protein L11 methyltransferase [Flavipsychrobacter sp.]|nr:50S ribosomal protein L11 methyltransferase [Flavipsychrobacter sp.]